MRKYIWNGTSNNSILFSIVGFLWSFGRKILQQLEKLNDNLFTIYILLRSAHQGVGQFVA
jgi:hypothetical protein